MNTILVFMLTLAFLLTGYFSIGKITYSFAATNMIQENETVSLSGEITFSNLNDPKLLQYVQCFIGIEEVDDEETGEKAVDDKADRVYFFI